jgi:hypothetical protein
MHRPALFNMDRFRKFVCIELTRVGISRKPLTVRRTLGEAAPARQVSMGLEKSDADCRGDVAAGEAEEGRRISGTGLPPMRRRSRPG